MIQRDDRAMMLDESRWHGPFCCIKHKDWTITSDDVGKGLGVVLAVKDKAKGEIVVLLDHNIYMPLDPVVDKLKTVNVDDLIAEGWYVD